MQQNQPLIKGGALLFEWRPQKPVADDKLPAEYEDVQDGEQDEQQPEGDINPDDDWVVEDDVEEDDKAPEQVEEQGAEHLGDADIENEEDEGSEGDENEDEDSIMPEEDQGEENDDEEDVDEIAEVTDEEEDVHEKNGAHDKGSGV